MISREVSLFLFYGLCKKEEYLENWHNLNIMEVLNNLGVKGNGLSTEEARNRINKYGTNELTEGKKISPLTLFLNQFKSALIIILLVAVALSVTVGIMNWETGSGLPEEITDAIVILVIVIACVFLGFIEEFRSEKALDALKKMAAPTATTSSGFTPL